MTKHFITLDWRILIGVMAPAHDATMLTSILPMGPADCMRLSAQTDVTIAGQRMRQVLQSLPKGRAAMSPLTVKARAHIEMGIDVDDAHWLGAGQVTEIVAIGRLVPAA